MYQKQGFTLIELLVVVLIIGILAGVAVPQYQKAVARARTAEALASLRAVAQAVELYGLEEGKFPDSWESLSVVPAGTIGTYQKETDQIIGRYYKFTLVDGRIDAGSRNMRQYPSFLYVSDFAKSAPGEAGKHFYCYVWDEGREEDRQLMKMCQAMGGGAAYQPHGGPSTWFALD